MGQFVSQSANFCTGLGKIILSVLIYVLSGLILFTSLKYLDPEFKGGYLAGRGSHSIELIRFALLLHSFSANLIIWIITPSILFRTDQNFKVWHRLSGRITVLLGLIVFIPTGLTLSYFAMGGILGKLLFIFLTIFSALCLTIGFITARQQRFEKHRIWMLRFFILLTSAIWLRLFMFIMIYTTGSLDDFQYLFCTLMSWLPQILIFEIYLKIKRGHKPPFQNT
jgi:hypothetical protein